MINFDPEKWLQLGIAGACIFSLLVIVVLFIRSLASSEKRWSAVVDNVTTRHDTTQKDTNEVLRQFAGVMNRIEVKIESGHKNHPALPPA